MISEPKSSGARRASQVVVLLDGHASVLSVNTGLAGTDFLGLTEGRQGDLHALLHPDCKGDCRFGQLWKTAWKSILTIDTVEWEVDDPSLGKLLRLNLTRPPTSKDVANDRRRRHAILTITDITRHRRDYESLAERERALLKLLRDRGVDPELSANDASEGSYDAAKGVSQDLERAQRTWGRQAILAQETERKRIAAELHDSIAQSAGVIKYQVEANIQRLSQLNPELDLAPLEEVVDQARALVDEIRRISANLAPSMLEDFGLSVALQELCREFSADSCDLRPKCEARINESELPEVVKFAVYRVVQEALSNIADHASAKHALVSVWTTDGNLQVEVTDDGRGFDADEIQRSRAPEGICGQGLGNMRQRVLATYGDFAIESSPGAGARILARWSRETLSALLGDETVLDRVDSHR